jgi:lipopolysaccharide assembly protein A
MAARSDQAKLIVAGVLGALIVVFALANADEVEVDWLVTTAQTPLIVVIVVSFLAGAVTGALALRRLRPR